MLDTSATGEFEFFDFEPDQGDITAEVLRGLSAEPKHISPKYFYDARGSALFEQITELAEYYLTRTEMTLFDRHLPAIAEILGAQVCLIEYGSGSSKKIRKVLETITPHAYVPIDISHEHLQANARELHQDFPHLHVYPVCADITQPFNLPEATQGLTKVGFFPGSSIGNFEPSEAQGFLRTVHATLGAGAHLLIGVDRKKPVDVLERAYNDADGVTAEFNLNLLTHLNERLGADFIVDQFTHDARYNEVLGCVQMFLKSEVQQEVQLAGRIVSFAQAEELHTENSYKYSPEEFESLAHSANFSLTAQWTDEHEYFGLYLLRADAAD